MASENACAGGRSRPRMRRVGTESSGCVDEWTYSPADGGRWMTSGRSTRSAWGFLQSAQHDREHGRVDERRVGEVDDDRPLVSWFPGSLPNPVCGGPSLSVRVRVADAIAAADGF